MSYQTGIVAPISLFSSSEGRREKLKSTSMEKKGKTPKDAKSGFFFFLLVLYICICVCVCLRGPGAACVLACSSL